jgi:hypothetical protein
MTLVVPTLKAAAKLLEEGAKLTTKLTKEKIETITGADQEGADKWNIQNDTLESENIKENCDKGDRTYEERNGENGTLENRQENGKNDTKKVKGDEANGQGDKKWNIRCREYKWN